MSRRVAYPNVSNKSIAERKHDLMIERAPSEWNEEFIIEMLRNTVVVPTLHAVCLRGTSRAACVFEHPDGTHVPLDLPLSALLYVRQYAPLMVQVRRELAHARSALIES